MYKKKYLKNGRKRKVPSQSPPPPQKNGRHHHQLQLRGLPPVHPPPRYAPSPETWWLQECGTQRRGPVEPSASLHAWQLLRRGICKQHMLLLHKCNQVPQSVFLLLKSQCIQRSTVQHSTVRGEGGIEKEKEGGESRGGVGVGIE